MAKGKENIDNMVKMLHRWQDIEKMSIEHCDELRDKTKNPLLKEIMEILRNDSTQHFRVQQFIIDSLTKTPVTLSPDDLSEIWDEIAKHDELEKETIRLAKELKKECRFFVQRALLDYLLRDEEKHEILFEQLEDFKRNIYPYA